MTSYVQHRAEPLHDKTLAVYDAAKKEHELQKAKYGNAAKSVPEALEIGSLFGISKDNVFPSDVTSRARVCVREESV